MRLFDFRIRKYSEVTLLKKMRLFDFRIRKYSEVTLLEKNALIRLSNKEVFRSNVADSRMPAFDIRRPTFRLTFLIGLSNKEVFRSPVADSRMPAFDIRRPTFRLTFLIGLSFFFTFLKFRNLLKI
jgi:hypothetical protein